MKLAEFNEIIGDYFARCDDAGVFPDESGLILALGLTRRAYDAYLVRKDRAGLPFRDALESARLKRESILERKMFADGKGRMFSARDDSSKPHKTEVEVIIRGETDYAE